MSESREDYLNALLYAGVNVLPDVGRTLTICTSVQNIRSLREIHTRLSKITEVIGNCVTALEVEEILKHVR